MTQATLIETVQSLRSGLLGAREVVSAALERADRDDAVLGAFIQRFGEQALLDADDADRRRARGQARLLEGVPIGIKDNIATAGGAMTAQSRVRRRWPIPGADAPVVGALRSSGAVVMGTLSLMEFAFGLPDVDDTGTAGESPGGATGQQVLRLPLPRSAVAPEHWAGGSSSGSGSAVAADFVLGALGTDTAGSIRIPAAYNAVTGLKPTYGRLERAGVVPLARTLDTVGPLARSAADCGVLLAALEGDAARAERWIGSTGGRLGGLRIGYDDLDRKATLVDPAQPGRMRDALAALTAAGARIVPVRLPHWDVMTAVDVVVCYREAYAYHRRMLADQWQAYGRGTRIVLAAGTAVTWEDYRLAQRIRRQGQAELAALFGEVDVVVTPTSHLGPPRLDAIDVLHPLDALPSLHTLYWNAQGSPTVALPIGPGADGTPLSLSASGPPGADDLVLRVGAALQVDTDWHRRPAADLDISCPGTAGRATIEGGARAQHGAQQDRAQQDREEQEAVERVRIAIRRQAALLRS